MARDFTVDELAVLREHLKDARTPNPMMQIAHILPVLDALVDALGEPADIQDREVLRRGDILGQYNARMAELLADPVERTSWSEETARSEVGFSDWHGDASPPEEPVSADSSHPS